MKDEKCLVLEIKTRSGSTYYIYKYDDMCLLKSSSKAFSGADFVVFNNLHINERLNFNGKVYFNAQVELYDKKYRIIPRIKTKKVMSSNFETIQKTSKIEKIDKIDPKEFKKLLKDKIISINEEHLEEYDLV